MPSGKPTFRDLRRVMMVLLLGVVRLSSIASARPAAFATWTSRRYGATMQRTFHSSLGAYSANTVQRTKGKDQAAELAKLAERMKVEEAQLKTLLEKNLSAMDPKTEKAEYIDWLLSSSSGISKAAKSPVRPKKSTPKNGVTQSPQTKKKTKGKKEQQTFATDILFADRPDLHALSKRAITEVMGLSTMTEIQDKTFEAASTGRDVLGRARTGTGKTVAFLLPAIERLLQSDDYKIGENIGIVVVSPTRELATQIGDQAEKLLTFQKGMNVQVMFGGTNAKRDIALLKRRLPTILVATPGRLLDHLQSTTLQYNMEFGKDIMSQTPIVVLDETDRLLDMGFRKEISKILKFFPRGDKRQTLLFSATIPPDLKVIMSQNMRKDFIEVDCINDGDAASHTNEQVQQSHVIVPFDDRFVSSVVELVQLAQNSEPNAKVVVFFPTARMVAFFAEFFNVGLNIPVIELHSKKSQSFRNRMSEQFRNAKSGVLFTSDVSARGVDYPNVSKVIQFGIPSSREQYIHRLGRTGRGGAAGTGWLVLSPWESLFLQELKGLEIPVNEQLHQLFESPMSVETEEMLEPVLDRIGKGDKILSKSAKGAYQAFLGYYLGQMKRMKMNRKDDLVSLANQFASLAGLHQPPPLTSQMVGKMGLKGVHGLNVQTKKAAMDNFGGRRGGNAPGGRPPRKGHSDGRRAPNADRSRGSRRG